MVRKLGSSLVPLAPSRAKMWLQRTSLSSLSNRCRTAMFRKDRPRMNIFPMIQSPCPHLLKLYLEISDGTTFQGIDDLSRFPSLPPSEDGRND